MTLRGLIAQSLRMVARDWRSGEVRLLVAALAVAVAALSSVAFFVDRAQQALQRDAAMFLGGDLALDSDRPIDASIRAPPSAPLRCCTKPTSSSRAAPTFDSTIGPTSSPTPAG